jgi:hypothetical protein
MKSSAILKKARKLIKSGEERFICFAVSRCRDKAPKKVYELEEFIKQELNGYFTLTGWVINELGIDVEKLPEFQNKIKQTRLNWIDHMIELYKAKGD